MDCHQIYRLTVVAVLLWCSAAPAAAQSGTFPQDPDGFLQAFTDRLRDTKREDLTQAAQALQKLYTEGTLDAVMVADMIEPASLMVDRRMGPDTYLLPFALAAAGIATNGHGGDRFSQWAQINLHLLGANTSPNNKPLRTWLEFSNSFFNTGVLSQSRSRSWEIQAEAYEFRPLPGSVEVFFPLAQLSGVVPGDTLVILRTRGSYFPGEELWRGTQGRIDFQRAGLSPSNVFVDFREYKINLGTSEVVIDTVLLTYTPLLPKPLEGRFVDKMVVNNTPEKTDYPQFRSFGSDPLAVELYPNVKYTGTFSLKGYRFQGFGSSEERATLEFYNYTGQLAVRARTSTSFVDDKDRIYSEEAKVTVYFGQDSIFHPNVKLRFDQLTSELTLTRENKGATSSPFYSSYHKVETRPDQIRWNINDSLMIMGPVMGLGKKEVDFSSINLFDEGLFMLIQGVVSYHPLVIMKRLVERSGGRREFQTLELAQEFNRSLTVEGVQAILYQLMLEGFIYYDKDQEKVFVQDKTINYVLSKGKKIDYDVIKIKSNATESGINSRMNIQTGRMDLQGVFEVNLSDSQFVRIFPKGKVLKLNQNRDMDFSGTVFGGSSDFYGDDFLFSYDSFAVVMSAIDSMVMFVPTGEMDRNGRPITAALNTTISGLSGTLYIDYPQNKSGAQNFEEYPYFKSNQPAMAHYDKPGVHGGAYDQERFFFEVDEFSVDSLDNIEPSRLGFSGTLKSDGIFPELRETLTVMPDRSLGFKTETPSTGLSLYEGKARYFDQVSLSNDGLIGSGRIEYLTTVLESDRFVFYPDSTKGMVNTLTINRQDKGVPFPQVANSGVALNWRPDGDSMTLAMRESSFQFFDGLTNLSGKVIVTPKGLLGSGVMDWDEARATSKDFRFGAMSMEADSTGFIIKSPEAERAALKLPNAYAKVDFEKRTGIFRANDEEAYTELPFNRYQTTVNDFAWDMNAGKISFNTSGRDFSQFRSQDPKQKGLGFQAKAGTYDMADHVLQLSGVPYIAVGDAHITPGQGEVVVEQDAVIRPIHNARIVFDSLYAYHVIEPATVKIQGRNAMHAEGDYRYLNRLDQEQIIRFGDIGVERRITETGDTLYETVARGIIPDSIPFYLDPKVLFKGPVKLTSTSEKVEFNGFARLNIVDTTYRAGWFAMNEAIESDNFLINIDGVLDENKDTAVVGIYRLFGSTDFYPSILAGTRRAKDKPVMRVKGFVQYREDEQMFIFGDPDKADGFSNRGSLLRFNDLNGTVEADGALNLMTDFGLCKVGAAAVTRKVKEDSVWRFRSTLGIKLLLTPELLAQFAQLFYDYNLDAEFLDYYGESSVFLRTLPQLVNAKEEERVMLGIETMAEFSRSKDYPFDMTFTDLNLVWNAESESWRGLNKPSEDGADPANQGGIAHIGDQTINQQALIAVEFAPRAAGDYFHVYVETELDDWFYFYYAKNVMKVISSIPEFNDAVNLTDPKKGTFKHPDGQQYSVMTIATVSERNRFLSKIGFFGDSEGEDEEEE